MQRWVPSFNNAIKNIYGLKKLCKLWFNDSNQISAYVIIMIIICLPSSIRQAIYNWPFVTLWEKFIKTKNLLYNETKMD